MKTVVMGMVFDSDNVTDFGSIYSTKHTSGDVKGVNGYGLNAADVAKLALITNAAYGSTALCDDTGDIYRLTKSGWVKFGGGIANSGENSGENGGENSGESESVTEFPALRLMDWEGTVLREYSASQVAQLTQLPADSGASHELLTFQKWNWSIDNIKSWVSAHEGKTLTVGAIYTTTDEENHNFWNNPRLDTNSTISMQKRGASFFDFYEFQDHYSLENINIPDGVVSIDNNAFYECRSLKSINIPNSVTTIDGGAFSSCCNLTNVNLPDSLTDLGSAFSNCYSLTEINIPDGVTSLNGTFSNCFNLTNVSLPDSLTSINSAFSYCYSLKEIDIPNGVTDIQDAFSGCYSLKGIDIPNGVMNIAFAFSDCHSLTSIHLPDSVTEIGNAFSNCYSLTNVNIPKSITNIGNGAFSQCHSLTNISIPNSVTHIWNWAFNDCHALADCVIKGTPTLHGTNSFGNTPSVLRIYVPREHLDWYSTATNWSDLYSDGKIVAIEDYIEYLDSIGIDVSEFGDE